MEPRYGVPINVNPNTLYAKANYKTIDEQLVFATNYICGMIEYKKLIDSQQLPVDKHNTMPLCMDQYYKIFGSCANGLGIQECWVWNSSIVEIGIQCLISFFVNLKIIFIFIGYPPAAV